MYTRLLSRKWLVALLLLLVMPAIGWFALCQRVQPSVPVALSTATPIALTSHLPPPAVAQQPESPLTHVNRNLQVATISPMSQTVDVLVYSNITIGFNRPAVVLASDTDHSQLPQPAHLEPEVPGKGVWTSPNHFQFQPKQPLAGGTTYRVVVEPFVGIEERKLETSSDGKCHAGQSPGYTQAAFSC